MDLDRLDRDGYLVVPEVLTPEAARSAAERCAALAASAHDRPSIQASWRP